MENSKAVRFNKMVRDKEDDELGLFQKYEEILEELRTKIIRINPSLVIDVGCGTANLCGELSKTFNVIGIDNSEEMLAYGRKKYDKMKFILGDFLKLPKLKEKAEVVVTTYALHSLNYEEKKLAIENMLQYIKQEGRLIIVDFMFKNAFERQSCLERLYRIGREDLSDFIKTKHYTNVQVMEEHIKSAGLKIHKEHIVNFTWILEIEKVPKVE